MQNLQKETKSYRSETGPGRVRVPDDVAKAWNASCKKEHRHWVLDEPSFVEYVLTRGMSRIALHEEFKVPENVISSSMRFYREKYAKEIRALKHRRYANAMKGNRRGARERPAVLLHKKDLSDALTEGRALHVIAEQFETSEWFVRANIKFHGLEPGTKRLPYRMQRIDEEYLRRLETFSPGIHSAALAYYDDPHGFYLHLHRAFCGLNELMWFVKDQARGHDYYREVGKIPKDHICWSINRYEITLSQALLSSGVPHLREFAFFKNFRADFAFPGTNLLVELDGEFHAQEDTATRDLKKAEEAARLGYEVLRFQNKAVMEDTGCVVQTIVDALSARSQASNRSASAESGT